MTDQYNAEKDPQVDEWTRERSLQELYDEGVKYFSASGFFFKRSILGSWMFHEIYVIEKPQPVRGVKYPDAFSVKVPLNCPEQIDKLQRLTIQKREEDEDFWAFWKYLVQPDPTRRRFPYGHVINLIQADIEARKVNSGTPFELGISTSPKLGTYPSRWVPNRDWFCSRLKDVKPSDVFTIFPEKELDMLMLVLGRLVVGRSNNLHVGAEEPVKHTARMAAVVVGFDPGTGKSTLFNFLNDAIGKCGYRQSTFRNLGDRFNLSEVVTSDWAYKDDVSVESFRKFLKSETTKIIITNGKVKCEQKGVDATVEDAHCTVVMNTNSFDPRSIYEVDPGTADRIKLLQTLSGREIATKEMSGVSEGSPNGKPFNHLPWLAAKLDVDIDALMLWVCRLAADEFLALVKPGLENHLEKRVRQLDVELKLGLGNDTMKQVLLFMHFCGHALGARALPKEISKCNWPQIFGHCRTIVASPEMGFVLEALEKDWLEKGKPSVHPWLGYSRMTAFTFVDAAHKAAEVDVKALRIPLGLKVREIFSCLFLSNGFRLSGDLVWISRDWELCAPYRAEVKRLARSLENQIEEFYDD
jgi:hypothetical protein